jgi:hypothetical protein
MRLTVINNTNNLRIVHSIKNMTPRGTMSVVYRKVDTSVIQLIQA